MRFYRDLFEWEHMTGRIITHFVICTMSCRRLIFDPVRFKDYHHIFLLVPSFHHLVLLSLDDPFHSVLLKLVLRYLFLTLVFYSHFLYSQHWCMRWSLVTWQPLSRGCTRAGPSITPEPKTLRTSYASIIYRKASNSECWSIFRRRGRSTTVLIVMR